MLATREINSFSIKSTAKVQYHDIAMLDDKNNYDKYGLTQSWSNILASEE